MALDGTQGDGMDGDDCCLGWETIVLKEAFFKFRELWRGVFGPEEQPPLWELNYVSGARRIWLQAKNPMKCTFIFGALAVLIPSEAKAFVDTIQSLYSMQAVLLFLVLAFVVSGPSMALRPVPRIGQGARTFTTYFLSSGFDQASLVEGAFIGMALPVTYEEGYRRGIFGTLLVLVFLIAYQHIAVGFARAQMADLQGHPLKWRLIIILSFVGAGAIVAYAFTIDPNFHPKP